MADLTKFSIVTFQRMPGLWRASITPADHRRRIASPTSGKKILSILTPLDSASEELARQAAKELVKNI
jgi:hypothetical protein